MHQTRRLLVRLLDIVILCLLLCGGQPTVAQTPPDSPAGSLTQADSRNVVLVGQLGGFARAVAFQGDYAYLALGARLVILNIANPATPVVVGQTGLLPDPVRDLAVSGGYAYVTDGNSGLRVVDVSSPAAPVEVGSYDTSDFAYGVAVSGDYVYMTDGFSGLHVVNVSNLAALVEVGFCDTPGIALGVAVSGGYVYVADGRDGGLRVLDVRNPAAPVEVGHYDTPGSAYDVAVSEGYAYVADGSGGGLRVVDVSNPIEPVQVGYYDSPGSAWDVAVSGGYAYVVDSWDASLRVVDVRNPAAPVEVGYYENLTNPYNVAVSGGYVYVADYDGLFILSYLPYRTFLPLVLRDYVHYFEGPWEVEPNDTYLQANGPLISGRDYTGYPNDQKDYFSIYLRQPGPLTINLTNHTGQAVQLQLFYQVIDNRVAFDTVPPYTITHAGQPGWYYVYIYTGEGYNSTMPYTLQVTYPE